jgi:class 3 adenylate cyclase
MGEPPRETVTFLFTDIEESTALTLSDEYPDALRTHRQLLGEVVEHEGGVVYGTLGDEVSAVFRTAAEAVAAAGVAQRSFAAEPWPGGLQRAYPSGNPHWMLGR